jgi:hypothetical protein
MELRQDSIDFSFLFRVFSVNFTWTTWLCTFFCFPRVAHLLCYLWCTLYCSTGMYTTHGAVNGALLVTITIGALVVAHA